MGATIRCAEAEPKAQTTRVEGRSSADAGQCPNAPPRLLVNRRTTTVATAFTTGACRCGNAHHIAFRGHRLQSIDKVANPRFACRPGERFGCCKTTCASRRIPHFETASSQTSYLLGQSGGNTTGRNDTMSRRRTESVDRAAPKAAGHSNVLRTPLRPSPGHN